MSHCAAALLLFAAAECFNFKADIGGWTIEANDETLFATWRRTGVVWKSGLFLSTARVRLAKCHVGSWVHEVHRESHGGVATMVAGEVLDNGSIKLQGTVPMASGTSDAWSLTLSEKWHTVSAAGSLAFVLHVQNTSAQVLFPRASDRHCPPRVQACHAYTSTDLTLMWDLDEHERVVGAGEQFSDVDVRGESFYMWSGEQGGGRGRVPITPLVSLNMPYYGGDRHTTYSAVPAFLSTRGYGVILENGQLIKADLSQKSRAEMTVSFEDRENGDNMIVSGHLLAGAGVREMLPALTLITGRMQAPPSWTSEGLVVGAEGGHVVVNEKLDVLRKADVSVAGVWVQDWSGSVSLAEGEMVWWNWDLDEERYPKSWFEDLRDRGIKVLTYVNPMLVAAPSSEGKPPTVFLEAKRLGHLLKDEHGEPVVLIDSQNGLRYGQIDVFRNESFQWWVNHMRCNVMFACEGDGVPLVHGWMHDYAEQLLFNMSVPAEYGIASDAHNLYTRRWAAAARKAAEEFPDVTFFTRSGDLKSPNTTSMFWLGDQLVSYDACDGMQSAIIGAMTGGMSGWTVTHCDLGGFLMVNVVPIPGFQYLRDAEMLVRWMEAGVFLSSGMLRSHMGLRPSQSKQVWDVEVLKYTKSMTDLYRYLHSYRSALLAEASMLGVPPVRHGMLVHPNDTTWFSRRQSAAPLSERMQCGAGQQVGLQQFFLGDDLLIAPVLVAGASEVEAYLPEGLWVHFWSCQTVRGPHQSHWQAPLGKPCMFYRADGGFAFFFRSLASKMGVDCTSYFGSGHEHLSKLSTLTV